MTWNVWWRFGDDWEIRHRAIVHSLEELQADVIGLQEAWGERESTQPRALAEQLGLFDAYAAPSLPPVPQSSMIAGTTLGVGLLSRWPIHEIAVERLPATQREPPVALAARVQRPTGPLRVVVCCVEWEPQYVSDHLAQTRALAHLVEKLGGSGSAREPVVLLADLNAPPEGREVEPLLRTMVDVWQLGGGGSVEPTLSSGNPHAPTTATKQIDQRIDYILVKPASTDRLHVERVFLAGGPVDGVYPSDHFAVVADLEI